MNTKQEAPWLYTISSKHSLLDLNLKEIWRYRDLLFLFVKRDIVTVYKQTILGPLWYLIQPLFTSVIFTLIFNRMGGIQTGPVPPFLFNLAGITAWNYFKECFMGTSSTFLKNQGIFGKVYFPRAIMPLSITFSNLLKFGIQLFIFGCFYIYYVIDGKTISPNIYLFLFPIYVLMMALLGLGLGMLVSSWTTKYRDLNVLLGFGVSLLMYLSAVPYPIAEAQRKFPDFVAQFVAYNPVSQIVEGFRIMFLSSGTFDWSKLLLTFIISVFTFFIGLLVFNKTEKTFVDSV
ncbi:ABC transporter permease [Mangrovimonas sp. ST2L15]|uniref:ABC transporter permease n=1 Tax=Mangrovimonas sp. ST2L15 TaxID=1645916 RepID=UPI0006B56297|nr:ABC transporter permease [Mangrovimonas sp. ST2L15]